MAGFDLSPFFDAVEQCDDNDFSLAQVSDVEQTDVAGNPIPPGRPYMEDPLGNKICSGGKPRQATQADVDAGIAESLDNTVINFAGYGDICIPEKADNFDADAAYLATLPTNADGQPIDSTGNVVTAGDEVIVIGGKVICLPKGHWLDVSEVCHFVMRDKNGVEIGRWLKDETEAGWAGKARNVNMAPDLNSMAVGDTVEYEYCKTFTNPSNCRPVKLEVQHHVSSISAGGTPPDWEFVWGVEENTYGSYIQFAGGILETFQRDQPINLSTGTMDITRPVIVAAGESLEVCNKVVITLRQRGAGFVTGGALLGGQSIVCSWDLA